MPHKLKPCPVCNGVVHIECEYECYYIMCKNDGCSAVCIANHDHDTCVSEWNNLPRKQQGIDDALAQAAMRHYGLENRLNQMQEELAEAMAAINHWRRGCPGAREELAEELADVLVVMEQLQVELGPEIARWVAEKKERLSKHAWFVEAQQGREPVI